MRSAGEPTGSAHNQDDVVSPLSGLRWPNGTTGTRAGRMARLVDVAPDGLLAALRDVLAAPADGEALDRCRRVVAAHAVRARVRGEPADATIRLVRDLLSGLQSHARTTAADRELSALLLWRTIRWVESEYI